MKIGLRHMQAVFHGANKPQFELLRQREPAQVTPGANR
jgi:hypothetical protein